MGKDYYQVLGLEPDATLEQIRSAFRAQAKKLHPDRTDEADCGPFREAREAYETLSDIDRRRAYDERCRRERLRVGWPGYRCGRPPVEVVDAGQVCSPYRMGWDWPARTSSDWQPVQTLLDQLWRTPGTRVWAGAVTVDALEIEIALTEAQARRGGSTRVQLPVHYRCQTCGGRGRRGPYWCRACEGRGSVERELVVEIPYPQHVPDGHVLVARVESTDVPAFRLAACFRVGGG
jgi:hypothetical protein